MTTQDEFLQTHAPDGVLTPQLAAQFLELAEGDTGAKALDNGGAPDASTVVANDAKAEQGTLNNVADATTSAPAAAPAAAPAPAADGAPQTEVDPDPTKTVIQAKDGVHTIPYQKLVDAREGEKHWKAQAETANAELTTLRAQAQQRADAGQAPTQTDKNVATATDAIAQGVDPDIFGDFSEKAIAEGILKLQNDITARMRTELKQELLSEVKAELAPLQQQHAVTAEQAHVNAIVAAHPDAGSLVESKELADWIAAQPSFARAGFQSVLDKGTTSQVIELFDEFKKATGATQAAAPSPAPAPVGDVKAAAKTAIANVPAPPPNSLSDIPGGRAGGQTLHEVLSEKSAPDLMAAMETMTPAQIEAYLNRQM